MWPSFFPLITVGLVREFFLSMFVNSKPLLEPDFSLLGWLAKGLSIGTCLQWGAYFIGTIDIHLKLSSNISKLVLSEKNLNP